MANFINDDGKVMSEEELSQVTDVYKRQGMGLTLREGNREYFYKMLDRHFPGLRQRYMAEYGLSYQVMSPNHRRLTALLTEFCQKHGILCQREAVFQYLR